MNSSRTSLCSSTKRITKAICSVLLVSEASSAMTAKNGASLISSASVFRTMLPAETIISF